MKSAEPAVPGFGELARRCLVHREWPEDTQPQARSLAALFSKLDRGIELEWLADRDAVQRTLALVLGCPLEAVQRELRSTSEPTTAGRLRLDDVPYARPLDLKEEPLPPGIPDVVGEPARWRWTWWRAPAGSGRSLAGQWLAARGRATFVNVRSWSEAEERLPPSGPVFIEVERPEPGAIEAALPFLRADVCIAAPVGPGAAHPPHPERSWQVVESPPPLELALPLARWLAERLPEDGAFDPERVARWLSGAVQRGELSSWGALLGAAGMLDARGAGAEPRDISVLAAELVSERLSQTSQRGSAEAHWLAQHGFEVLVRLAQTACTDSERAWDAARSRDEWIALIPAEFQQSVDADWLRWSLGPAQGQAVARDLERALRGSPPGAYRLVRALIEARLLRSRGATADLSVAPEFVKHAALTLARQRLISEGSPFSWGEGLLRSHAASGVLEELERRLAHDDYTLVEALLELDVASQPALIAAAEAVFVALGLQLLSGADVPLEHLEQLWNEQLGWLVELPGELPQPRLLGAVGVSSPLADRAVWALSALAISETLADARGASHPVLRPWRKAEKPAELERLLDGIFRAVCRPELAQRDWAVAAFALAARLYGTDGPSANASGAPPHRLARPAWLVSRLLAGSLEFEAIADWRAEPIELAALRWHCELAGVSWTRLVSALWRCWQLRGCPASGDALFGPASAHRSELWRQLPPEVLDLVWSRWAPLASAWPFECFGPTQWSAFAGVWARRLAAAPDFVLWSSAFQSLAREAVAPALAALLTSEAVQPEPLLALLWSRFPEQLGSELELRLEQGDAKALERLLRAAPPPVSSDVLRRLTLGLARRSTPRASLDEARRWLWQVVQARGAEWRSAYALAAELEGRVLRVLKARGSLRP